MDADPAELVGAVVRRTDEIVDALGALEEWELFVPSSLPEWSRLTIACHLRYGARALDWMTTDTVSGRPTAYYPEGRATQRPGTLEPGTDEAPGDVVTSLEGHAAELHERWSALTPPQWDIVVTEPGDNPDLGDMPLRTLLILRLTEVEVHGTDLDLGLSDWSAPFVAAALPIRIRRLDARTPAVDADGSWLLVADDGPTSLVTARATTVHAEPATSSTPADAVVEGSSRDLLALLLGRPTLQPLRYRGDADIGLAFGRVFPGP